MPSALVYRMTGSNSSVTNQPHNIHVKNSSLPHNLVSQLSQHAPSLLNPIPDTLYASHARRVGPGQASSAVVRLVPASVNAIWSILRRFDNPLAYKRFLKSCRVIRGDGGVGTVREVRVVSGLPATWSTERLDVIDEEEHVVGFSVVGGDHRLVNYQSVTTLHGVPGGTVVVESYAVDVPVGNTREDTWTFADTVVGCNLDSLAEIAERDMVLSRVE